MSHKAPKMKSFYLTMSDRLAERTAGEEIHSEFSVAFGKGGGGRGGRSWRCRCRQMEPQHREPLPLGQPCQQHPELTEPRDCSGAAHCNWGRPSETARLLHLFIVRRPCNNRTVHDFILLLLWLYYKVHIYQGQSRDTNTVQSPFL